MNQPDLNKPDLGSYYTQQYNTRAAIADHPYIFTRWVKDSAQVRSSSAALLDLMYGEAAGERLDFFPARRGGAPLLVFIHGGWWRSLDKFDFSFITPAFRQAGFNVALTNYTLAPTANIGEIIVQQQRALVWLYQHAEQYDFNPDRIFIAGHSAGAHLAAMLLSSAWPKLALDVNREPSTQLPADLLKAGILLSGVYDLEPLLQAPFVNVDLQLTPEQIKAWSPLTLATPKSPFISAVGALESDEFKRQTALLGRTWSEAKQADYLDTGTNHLTICDSFATPGTALCDASLEFLQHCST
ncbi:MAG: alpha/beta hydrolase [Herbaspirillum sp.]